jgi:hypothetical protein
MRSDRKRARKRAHQRFYVTMLVLLAATCAIVVLIWQTAQNLFGI